MTAVSMLTVGGIYPLAGGGKNTIRMKSAKYAALRPGDFVHMAYVNDVSDKQWLMSEMLEVASVVHGTRRAIIAHHWKNNHASRNYSQAHAMDLFQRVYPDSDDDTPFCAVYFK